METRENPRAVGRDRFIAPLRADPYANGRFVGSRRKWRNAVAYCARPSSPNSPPRIHVAGSTSGKAPAHASRWNNKCGHSPARYQAMRHRIDATIRDVAIAIVLVADRTRLEACLALARRAVEPRSQR